jgi:hypothetical protein
VLPASILDITAAIAILPKFLNLLHSMRRPVSIE